MQGERLILRQVLWQRMSRYFIYLYFLGEKTMGSHIIIIKNFYDEGLNTFPPRVMFLASAAELVCLFIYIGSCVGC